MQRNSRDIYSNNSRKKQKKISFEGKTYKGQKPHQTYMQTQKHNTLHNIKKEEKQHQPTTPQNR